MVMEFTFALEFTFSSQLFFRFGLFLVTIHGPTEKAQLREQ